MKVKSADGSFVHPEPKPAGRSAEAAMGAPAFEAALKNSAVETRKQVCTAILAKIDQQSAALKKSLTVAGVKRYRELVGEFMKEALHDSYQLTGESKWDRMGNRKEYVIVKRVNESLEELMAALAGQAKEQLDLIAKLDEIRGMLVDLYC